MRYIKFTIMSIAAAIIFNAHAAPNTVLGCRTIDNNNERLACYDKLAKSLMTTPSTATQSKNKPTVNAKVSDKKLAATSKQIKSTTKIATAKIAKTKTQLTESFGQRAKKVVMPESVEFTVKLAKLSIRKKWQLTFENGQVWHASEVGLRLKAGTKVIIKRGALNSFLLKKKGSNRSIRVKRIK